MTAAFSNVALGGSLPPYAAHAISVSLPTWRDNVAYEEGDRRVLDKMVSGYPRFFILLPIQKASSPLILVRAKRAEKPPRSSPASASKSTPCTGRNACCCPPAKRRTSAGRSSSDGRRRCSGGGVRRGASRRDTIAVAVPLRPRRTRKLGRLPKNKKRRRA